MALALCVSVGCRGKTPSAKLGARLSLPSPVSLKTIPRDERLRSEDQGERHVLTPHSLIPIAFNRQPDIKSSFQRFKSEEARYDFFYASRDSLTPKFSLGNEVSEFESLSDEGGSTVDRGREHIATLSLEKRFFDTTQLDVGLGYDWLDESASGYGAEPFINANLRYPVWGSRERLERTSEEIFRRNELSDTQLAFIKTIRSQLQHALNLYYRTIFNRWLRDASETWRTDLEALLPQLDQAQGHDSAADRRRVEAEITSVKSQEAGYATYVDVLTARLKGACGLPFHAQVELAEVDFDPFKGMSHEELLQLGIKTDPEIATLYNARDNSQVQLDLARRGRWDVALLLGGESHLEGYGVGEGASDWSVSLGLEVAAVDPRVTRSLIRQATADIGQYTEAMAARENAIFVNTLEPQRRNVQLAETKQELIDNLPLYRADYQGGVSNYLASGLNIDNLLKRRSDLYAQEEEIALQALYMGMNVSSLCAETGKFFELLNGEPPPEAPAPSANRGSIRASPGLPRTVRARRL
ncbi:MAG: TolC family protein [Phycisphaerae bacterium]|nr:TolC family protein [Phycisphaerae bacterium]